MIKLKRDISLHFIYNIIKLIYGILLSILTARSLGPSGKGILTLLNLIIVFSFQFGNLGLNAAVVYYSAKFKKFKNKIFWTNFIFTLCISFFIILIFEIALKKIIINRIPNIKIGYIYFIVIYMSIIMYFLKTITVEKILYGIGKIRKMLLTDIILTTVLTGILIYLYIMNKITILNIILLNLSSLILFTVFLIHNINIKFNIKFDCKLLIKEIRYGIKAYLSNLSTFINYRADIFLIAYYLNMKSVGIYSIGINITEKIWLIAGAVSQVLFPYISMGKNKSKNVSYTAFLSKINVYLSGIILIILFFIIPYLINYLWGSKFYDAVNVIRILIPGVTIIVYGKIISSYFAGVGKPQYATFSSIGIMTVNIILNIILIPKLGINGAAIASTISYSLGGFFWVVLFCKKTKTSISEMFILKIKDLKYLKEKILSRDKITV